MKSNVKRFMGIILAMLMVVAMIPATAFADHTFTGSPNVFTIVSSETDKEIEYLLVDTMTQGGETYYGLMLRKSVHGWAGEDTIKFGDGCNLGWSADNNQTSTASTVYMQLYTYLSGNMTPINGIIDQVYPESVKPYIATLEHEICNDTTGAITFKTVDSVTIPTYDMLADNSDYILLQGEAGNAQSGSLARGNSAWKGGSEWIRCMQVTGDEGFGQMCVDLNYYWHPLVYVSGDFFTNVKIDTTKEVGDNVKNCLSDNFSKSQLSGLYTDAELGILGNFQEAPTNIKPEHSPNYLKLENGTKLLYNGEMSGDYMSFTLVDDLAGIDGAEGFVISNGEYYIAETLGVSSGVSVADAAMDKLPVEMQDLVQTRAYGVNTVGGAGALSFVNVKASIPSHATLEKHGTYIDSLIKDNSVTAVGGYAGANGLNDEYAAVNDHHPWFQYAFPDGAVVSDGGYFVGSIFPEFYVHKNFFKSVKLNTSTIGENIKEIISTSFVKNDFVELGYTEEELAAMGVVAFIENQKPTTDTTMSYKFAIGAANYVVLPDVIEENGKKYFGVINTDALTNTYGTLSFVTDPDEEEEDLPVRYGELLLASMGNWTTWDDGVYTHSTADSAFADKFFPADIFGDYISERDWTIETMVLEDGAFIEDNQWPWMKSEGLYSELRYKSTVGVPTATQLYYAMAADPTIFTSVTALTTTLVNADAWWITAGWRMVLPGPEFPAWDATPLNLLEDTMYIDTCVGGRYGSAFVMAYVSEDFFKEFDIDISKVGDGFKAVMRENFTSSDMTGWSSAAVNAVFGGYYGEGLGLEAYKGSTGVEVVVHNNGTEAAGNGAVIIVSVYEGKALKDIKFFTLEKNLSANAYTNPINFDMGLSDNENVTYKAMLWSSFSNCKPLADSVEFN